MLYFLSTQSFAFSCNHSGAGAPAAPLGLKGPIPPIRVKWPEGSKGLGTLSAKLTEGIRTLKIPEHSDICNPSPPSFSSKMPPPLTMRGMARGGLGVCAFASFFVKLRCRNIPKLPGSAQHGTGELRIRRRNDRIVTGQPADRTAWPGTDKWCGIPFFRRPCQGSSVCRPRPEPAARFHTAGTRGRNSCRARPCPPSRAE